MLQKLKKYSGYKERQDFINEAERMIHEYGWEERTVMPYSFEMKITKIIDDFKGFDNCTGGSQSYLISLVNGLADTLNAWEKNRKEATVSVLCENTGEIIKVKKDLAEILVGYDGYAIA